MQHEPEICNCAALRQASRVVTNLYDGALAPVGLGVNQYSILARLRAMGPSTLSDLAARLVTDRSTLGHLLRPLQRRGLLKVTTGKKDRRERLLSLTPSGEALLRRARPLWSAAQHKFETAFGKEEALQLRATLRALTNSAFQ